MAESDNILTELQDLLLYLIPQLRACLKTRFGRGDNPGGVRPSSGAAMLKRRRAWIFRVRLKCSHCCARGRAYSDAGLFKQALNKFPRDQKFVPAHAPMTVRDLMEKTNGIKPREARAAAAIYF